MKTLFFSLALIFTLWVHAQVIPDYTASALGLTSDVVSTTENTYIYNATSKTYDLEEKMIQKFSNGRLISKYKDTKGIIASTINTEYTYTTQGNILKEVETLTTDYSSNTTTTDYFYEKSLLVKIITTSSFGSTTTLISYQNGKPVKAEKRNATQVLESETVYFDVTDAKNYKQKYTYYSSDGSVLSSSTDTYQNGFVLSSDVQSTSAGNMNYIYSYDAQQNLVRIYDADYVTHYSIYEKDPQQIWIKKKTDEEDWLIGDVFRYSFRKIEYKTTTTGSDQLDMTYINRYPPDVETADITNTVKKECEGNCSDGFGIKTYNDNSIYTGFFTNNLRNGVGFYAYSDGSFSGGEWKDDNKTGFTLYSWSDKSVFYGYFSNDKYNGLGVYIDEQGKMSGGNYSNGTLIQSYQLTPTGQTKGCVGGDCQNGFGKIVYDDGSVFVGYFLNGQLSHGNLVYKNGDSYIGQFTNNMKHGFGIYVWPEGSIFIGKYQNDNYHGQGYYDDRQNKSNSVIGIFNNGSLSKDMSIK